MCLFTFSTIDYSILDLVLVVPPLGKSLKCLLRVLAAWVISKKESDLDESFSKESLISADVEESNLSSLS
jgi:hypothetical protein